MLMFYGADPWMRTREFYLSLTLGPRTFSMNYHEIVHDRRKARRVQQKNMFKRIRRMRDRAE